MPSSSSSARGWSGTSVDWVAVGEMDRLEKPFARLGRLRFSRWGVSVKDVWEPDCCHGERGSESKGGDAALRLRDGVKRGVVGEESGCAGWKKTPWFAAMVGVGGSVG